MFLGLGLGNRKTNEGNGLRGYLQCSSACEIEGWGSAASSPRRRRGGGRETVLGGVAKGGSSSARGKWVQGSRGDAWGGGETGVGLRPAQSGGGRRGTVGRRGKQSRQAGEEDRDLNAISKNFRGITIK